MSSTRKRKLENSDEPNESKKREIQSSLQFGKSSNEGNKENALSGDWKQIDSVYYCDYGVTVSDELAMFDLDQTLIYPRSGKAHPQDENDWKFWSSNVPSRLRKEVSHGKMIVIISNQKGVSLGLANLAELKKKLDAIKQILQVPFVAFLPTEDDIYRKPRPGILKIMQKLFFSDASINLKKSFYVGDLAGREINGMKKKDRNASDRYFAFNIGIEFFTPEEFFKDQRKNKWPSEGFDPRYLLKIRQEKEFVPFKLELPTTQEVVMLIGPPGSGKSRFCRTNLSHYERVNQDSLGTRKKCEAALKAFLQEKKSVVIDCQNETVDARKLYISICKEQNITIRAVCLDVSKNWCFHWNRYRTLCESTKEHRVASVPPIVIHTFFKKKQLPTSEEGFSEIHVVPEALLSIDDVTELAACFL
eukprot:GHVP01043224.1.p1 GENE.GHVP01043224.1~~GHVP01043224.1.p1  ORF type:complete len:418 (-),score=78.81 GHVP01043224.1:1154-2407(-)